MAQIEAVTGRKVPPQYAAMVQGQASYAPSLYSAGVNAKNAEKSRLMDIAQFDAQQANANRDYGLAQSELKNRREMDRYGTMIQAANMLANFASLGKSDGGGSMTGVGNPNSAPSATPTGGYDTATALPGGMTGAGLTRGGLQAGMSAAVGNPLGVAKGVNTALGNIVGSDRSPVNDMVNQSAAYAGKANAKAGPFAAPAGALYGLGKGALQDAKDILSHPVRSAQNLVGYESASAKADVDQDLSDFYGDLDAEAVSLGRDGMTMAETPNMTYGTPAFADNLNSNEAMQDNSLTLSGVAKGLSQVGKGIMGGPQDVVPGLAFGASTLGLDNIAPNAISMTKDAYNTWSDMVGPLAAVPATMQGLFGLGLDAKNAVTGLYNSAFGDPQTTAVNTELNDYFGELDAYEASLKGKPAGPEPWQGVASDGLADFAGYGFGGGSYGGGGDDGIGGSVSFGGFSGGYDADDGSWGGGSGGNAGQGGAGDGW